MFKMKALLGSTAPMALAVGLAGVMVTSEALAAVDQITVTARKKEESILNAPVSVSAFTQEQLQRQGITSVRELAQQVPGFSFNEGFGRRDDRPAVRGLTAITSPDFGAETGTAVFIDGVYVNMDISALGLADLERIEVVRGPQSALYGRNSYSGAINFVTRKPGNEFEYDASALYAEHASQEYSVAVSGPILQDVLSFGLFARHYSYGGEYENPNPLFSNRKVGDEETNSVSGTLVWTPTDIFDAQLRLAYVVDNDGHIPFELFRQAEFGGALFPALSGPNDDYFKGVLPPPGETLDDSIQEEDLVLSGMEREQFLATLVMNLDLFDGYTLTSASGFRDEDRDTGSDSNPGSPSAITPVRFSSNLEVNEYSTELRFASPDADRLTWMVGGFYYYQEYTPTGLLPTLTGGSPAPGDERITENYSVFGSLAFDFTDRLSATLELRQAWETKEISDPDVPQFDAENTFESFNPRLTVDFQATEDLLFYGIVARGNKPGGFNDDANRGNAVVFFDGVETPFFDEETSWSYELGLKSSWLEDRLTFKLSGYYTDVEGVQLTQNYSSCAVPAASPFACLLTDFFVGANFLAASQVINLGDVDVYGLEAEVQAVPDDNLRLTFGYAYTHPEIVDGAVADQTDLFGDPSVNGNIMPRISEHQINASALYTFPMANNGQMFFGGDFSYESSRFVQVHNLAETGQAFVFNGRFGWENERMSIALFGKNLGDEDAVVDALRFRDFDSVPVRAFQVVPRKGRQIGIEARIRY